MKQNRFWLITAALLIIAAPVFAQASQPAQTGSNQPFEGSVEVTEVLLDVLVTDRDGNVILGLGPEDFVIEEDGRPVDVTGLTFYSNRRLAETAPAELRASLGEAAPPDDRFFILFFQDQRRAAADTNVPIIRQQIEAGRRAKEWVREEVLLNDWIAVASYDYKLKVHLDFTRDRGAVERAIERALKGHDARGNWPSRLPEDERVPSILAELPTGKALSKETGKIYDAISVLAEATGPIAARKNLVMFGSGFGRLNSFGQYVPESRWYNPMMQAMNDNNVAAYTIDLLPSNVDTRLSDSLNQLASDTGGEYYFNFTNFVTPLRQIATENNGYYLLSYRSEHPSGQRGFQEVSVKSKNPQFEVKARKGYSYGSPTT